MTDRSTSPSRCATAAAALELEPDANEIGDNYAITMTGPVTHVANGVLAHEMLENL